MRHAFIVLTNSLDGKDAEFNEWYDDVHLPDVLAVPGFVAAQRFRIADDDGTAEHRYLTIYEIDADDVSDAVATMRSAAATMDLGDAIDLRRTTTMTFTSVGPRRTARGDG